MTVLSVADGDMNNYWNKKNPLSATYRQVNVRLA